MHSFPTSELDEGKWSGSSLRCFTRLDRNPYFQWVGDWVGSRIGDVLWGQQSYLDPALKKKKQVKLFVMLFVCLPEVMLEV